MKKIFSFLTIITLITPVYADKLLKDGFLNSKMDYAKEQNILDPKNKIIIIFNHGQDKHDKSSKNCVWKNGIRNFSSLVGEKINEKEIMVYLFCTNKLAGDDHKRLWDKKKFKPPYKGVTKLDKRVDANLKLIDSFLEKGVPKNQIILTGHSCGGWLTMMLMAKYPNKVGGGISLMQACYGKLSKRTKVKKVGVDKALKKFREKEGDGPADLRQNQINEIKKSKNLPVLVFTHPKDPYDGLLSDWVEEIPGVKRIVISEDKKINGKKCFRIGVNNGKEWKEKVKKYHDMDTVDCFQYYNQTILDYISSRVSS
jgi:predicted esterase